MAITTYIMELVTSVSPTVIETGKNKQKNPTLKNNCGFNGEN